MSTDSEMPPKGSYVPIKDEAAVKFLDEAEKIIDREKAGSLKPKGAENKLREGIGELGSRRYVERTYHGRIKKEIVIPRRGTKGPHIIDIVYELEDGRLIVVESKQGAADLGKVNRRIFQMGDTIDRSIPTGVLSKEDQQKLSDKARKAYEKKQRRKKNKALKQTLKIEEAGIEQFSPQWYQDRIKEIRRKDPRLANKLERAWYDGKTTALVIHVDDYGVPTLMADKTNEWNLFKQRGIPDVPIKTPAVSKKPKVSTAPNVAAKDLAPKPSDLGTPKMNDVQDARGVHPINDSERLITGHNTGLLHTPADLPSARLVSDGFKKPGFRSVFKVKAVAVGAKVWRVTRAVGKILIIAFVPTTILEVLLDVALEFLDRSREKKERKERDKQRAIETIFSDQAKIETLIRKNILDEKEEQEHESVQKKWTENLDYPGFVYARLVAELDKKAFLDSFGNEIEEYTEYKVANLRVMPVDIPTDVYHTIMFNDIGDEKELEPLAGDPPVAYVGRKISQKKKLLYPLYPPVITPFDIVITRINNLFLDLVYFIGSFPDPPKTYPDIQNSEVYLKSFDHFKYREPNGNKVDYQDQFNIQIEFKGALNGERCEYCLKYLHWAARHLSEHPLKEDHYRGNIENPKKGWSRRLGLLSDLLERRGNGGKKQLNFLDFAEKLKGLVNEKKLAAGDVETVQDAVLELNVRSMIIWRDLLRIEKKIKMPEYYYYGPQYKISN